MHNLTPTQLVILGKWRLGGLYLNPQSKATFLGYARASFLNLSSTFQGASKPSKDDVHPYLRADLLSNVDFINTVIKANPYIQYRNTSSQSTFYTLANMFSVYIITKDWPTISI